LVFALIANLLNGVSTAP